MVYYAVIMEPMYKVITCLYEARKLMTGREIAEKTGLTEKQVRNVCTKAESSDLFKIAVIKTRLDTRSKLELNGYTIDPRFVRLVSELVYQGVVSTDEAMRAHVEYYRKKNI